MSPSSTARHPSKARKVALCAAALVVTILPTACSTAYAGPEGGHSGHEVVEVGGSEAVDPADDDDGAGDDAADDAAGEDQNAGNADGTEGAGGEEAAGEEAGGEEAAAEEGQAEEPDTGQAEQDPPAEEQNGDNNGAGDNGGDNGGGDNNGLDVLGTDCSNSELEPHDGFEEAPRCVSTSFGEVAGEDRSPSLLITESPQNVAANEEFEIAVSTRNLVRDRFLGAAAGGYYLESSFLNDEGLQRGHFHTACRMLESTDVAPDAEPEPEFFLATQDNGGGADPDEVRITVSGMPQAGTAQCAVWAGDGSHRLPMMQRANQTPAFDIVRIEVR